MLLSAYIQIPQLTIRIAAFFLKTAAALHRLSSFIRNAALKLYQIKLFMCFDGVSQIAIRLR
ncbi:hypothetical protein Plhal304r1_c017g0062201 [Plasmopara halstedii]